MHSLQNEAILAVARVVARYDKEKYEQKDHGADADGARDDGEVLLWCKILSHHDGNAK